MREPLDQFEPPKSKDEAVIGKIVFWNFAAILIYTILSGLVLGVDSVFFDIVLILNQLLINFILAVIVLIQGRVQAGIGFLFSILLIILLGLALLFSK